MTNCGERENAKLTINSGEQCSGRGTSPTNTARIQTEVQLRRTFRPRATNQHKEQYSADETEKPTLVKKKKHLRKSHAPRGKKTQDLHASRVLTKCQANLR